MNVAIEGKLMQHIYRLAAPFALLSVPALAQGEAMPCPSPVDCAASDDQNQPAIIVTGTGAAQQTDESGLAIALFNSDAIARLQPATIAELLVRTPGVTISNTGPIGGFSAVRIRGAEGEQTLALVDGVRINDPASPGGGFDFGNLLIGNIEQVEVLRGPNSVPWGSQAIGGVVNIVTRRPTENIAANLRAEYGGNDRGTLAGNMSGRSGPIRYSFGGGWFRDDGISAAASGSERDGFRQYGANGRIEVDLSEAIHLDLRGYHADSRAELDGFPAPSYMLTDTAEYSTTGQTTGYAGLHASTGRLASRLSLTLNDINRANFSAPGAVAADFLARGRSERIEYQGDWRVGSRFRAIFGAEHERSRFTDGFSPARTHYSGAYAQAVVDLVPALTLTAGARIDRHKNYGSKTTFSTNAVIRPAPDTIIRAAYGEGFKAPTLFQLFSFFGDPGLQPEQAESHELGIEQSVIGDKLRFGATAYRRRTRNMIDFDLLLYRYGNILGSRASGVETFVELHPDDRLTIMANYSYTNSKGRQDDGGAYIRRIRIPAHSLNLMADWMPIDRLKLGADIRLASDSVDGFGGAVRMDGYTLFNLRAAYQLSDKIELYGRVENAGDVRYETVAGYGNYGRAAFIGMRTGF
jgi:vitamin B12 transporter